MSLPAREQQVLDGIETVLRDSEAGLTAMFGIFTRLAGDEAKPWAEEFRLPSQRSRLLLSAADGLSRDAGRRSPAAGRWPARGSAEWPRVLILLAMLVAAVGAAVILSITTTSTRTCGPATATHAAGSSRSQPGSCPTSPAVPTPTSAP